MTYPSSPLRQGSVREPFWSLSIEESFRALESGPDGLLEEEALERKTFFGPNKIFEGKGFGKSKIILNQFRSPLILILVAAGVVTVFLYDWVDAGVIFAAVAANTALGFWQENRAEQALSRLKTYIRTRARVRRGGVEHDVDAAELVPGDVVRITQGDRIPADCRLAYVNNFEVDEAVLTGESLPIAKQIKAFEASVGLADRASMVFGGTLAVQGFADALVTATGSATEFGRIAALVASARQEPTPLQRALARFASRAGAALGALAMVLFAVGLRYGYPPGEMFLIAVAVAVSAVPEGLPVALTVILAVGVERLARRKGVVRKLLAAETLGSTTLILTDKTGTLTQARMQLVSVVPRPGSGVRSNGLLASALALTDVVIENPDAVPEEWVVVGRPIEAALVRGAAEQGVLLPDVRGRVRIRDRLPFSSQYKFSAAVVEAKALHGARSDREHEEARLVCFGAPDFLVECTDAPEMEKQAVRDEVSRRAVSGERVLGVASRPLGPHQLTIPADRKIEHLVFDGLISFHDPLRPGIAGAIRQIADAGVRTVIVTGDHRGTAEAVARELGMVDGAGAVLTGDDLKYLTSEELRARAPDVRVWARVTPEEKVAIAKLYKGMGEIVALTGDGVNDAPALGIADIGIAVGSGTDVAKDAADLVILDDNFETIVSAIEEGRKVLDNIRKVVVYLLSDALDELLLIGGALVFGLPIPLSALQILFVNFFSDSFPAIALAFEQGVDGLGGRPRRLHKNLFDRQMKFLILGIGILTSALPFVFYAGLLKFGFDEALARTFIFAAFSTYTLFLVFSVRSLEKSIFHYNPLSNPYLVVGSSIGLALTGLVIYVPFLQGVFKTVPLPPPWLLAVLGVGALNIAAVEFGKWLFRKRVL